jgi:hypothetical protein
MPLDIPPGMPMPGGAPPPGMGAPGGGPPAGPAHMGPISSPQPQAGNAAAGHQKLMIAMQALQDALPSLPMGSELHSKVLKVTQELTKELQATKEDPQLQIQSLMGMIKQLAQQAPNQAVARLPSPNAPPMMPQQAPPPDQMAA